MGVTSTLAFGPIMLRNGEYDLNRLKKFAQENAPRTVIGMVEPGHYFAMMMEGRYKESYGDSVENMTYRMKERGVMEAINLDGGETACILFMGKQLNVVGNTNHANGAARRTPELLAIGRWTDENGSAR